MNVTALDGRTVILTGAGGGLGRAMTAALCAAGANVAGVDAVPSLLAQLEAEIGAAHPRGRLLPVVADLRDPAQCAAAVDRTLAEFGGVHGLVNNAGVGLSTIREDYYVNNLKFWEVPDERWRSIIDTNATAAFLLAKAVVAGFLAQRWGRIVNVTTSMDTMIRRGWTPYGPSKAALEACSAIWAKDLADTGVTVNVLVPGGPADTPMVPAASSPDRAAMLQPAVMQAPIVWLMSDESDGFTGNRLTGTGWDVTLPAREAAERAAAPAAWPGVGQQAIWPEAKR